eukprot:TRINITY_DN7563_c0_g3_i2.p1 TRINITY_DN7563_c0_g3~~TRINITY_DN7563_c0_g3_i2.p1  ORF type:complete len:366 (-),score=17.73 TRINITY_DN7563_c0_g3_i2:506-1603(-)
MQYQYFLIEKLGRDALLQVVPYVLKRRYVSTGKLRLISKDCLKTVDAYINRKFSSCIDSLESLRLKSQEADTLVFNEENPLSQLQNQRMPGAVSLSGEHFKMRINNQHMILEVANFGPIPSIVKGLVDSQFGQQFGRITKIQLKGFFHRFESMNGACVAYLAAALPKLKALVGFSAVGSFGDSGVSVIAAALTQTGPQFKELSLESDCKVERGACELARVLAKNNFIQNVQFVNLLREGGVRAFCATIHFSQSLVSIQFCKCKIDDEQVEWISSSLRSSRGKLQLLDLQQNLIKAEGAKMLIEACRTLPSLKTLNLSFNKVHLSEIKDIEDFTVRGHIGILYKQFYQEEQWVSTNARLMVYCQVY